MGIKNNKIKKNQKVKFKFNNIKRVQKKINLYYLIVSKNIKIIIKDFCSNKITNNKVGNIFNKKIDQRCKIINKIKESKLNLKNYSQYILIIIKQKVIYLINNYRK